MLPDLFFDPSHCLIGGEWKGSADTLPIINPSNGNHLGAIARCGATEVDEAVHAARQALHGAWGKTPPVERGRLLHRLSELVTRHVDLLARLESMDVGKPLTQARASGTNDAVAVHKSCGQLKQ